MTSSCLENILDNMETIVYVSDLETNEILFANAALQRLYGERQLMGGICWQVLQGKNERCDFCPLTRLLEHPELSYHWEYYNPQINRHFLIQDKIIPWAEGKTAHLEYGEDITEIKNAQNALATAAATDSFTSTLNRTTFMGIADGIFRQAQFNDRQVTLAFVDIDKLKWENDSFGHAAGDRLIHNVVQVLRENIRESDILGRYGGDEFVVVFNKCDKANAKKRLVKALKILNDGTVREPGLGAREFSFGLAGNNELAYAENSDYVQKLIEIADRRMFEQKKRKGVQGE